jgi:UDP-glucose 4-epimerase
VTRVLITGGAGFIGSHLSERLLAQGDTVTVLDDLSTGQRQNLSDAEKTGKLTFIQGTVLDEELVRKLISEHDHIYHLAAAVGVDIILRQPLKSLETNIRGTENVLKACDDFKKRVLIASTSEVYGKNDRDALNEDDDRILGSSKLSRWFYSAAKAIDESFSLAYYQERQLPVVIVRFFNTVGPRQTGRYGMVVPRFVRQALRNEAITVFGDGQQTRCFTNVRDVVTAITKLMATPNAVGEIFNIGQPGEISILELAHRVIETAGSESTVKLLPYSDPEAYGERAANYEDMRRRVPDASKLEKYTGFKPTIQLEQTLREVVDFERSQLAAAGTPNG